jgi:hypothetical protein
MSVIPWRRPTHLEGSTVERTITYEPAGRGRLATNLSTLLSEARLTPIGALAPDGGETGATRSAGLALGLPATVSDFNHVPGGVDPACERPRHRTQDRAASRPVTYDMAAERGAGHLRRPVDSAMAHYLDNVIVGSEPRRRHHVGIGVHRQPMRGVPEGLHQEPGLDAPGRGAGSPRVWRRSYSRWSVTLAVVGASATVASAAKACQLWFGGGMSTPPRNRHSASSTLSLVAARM